VFGMYYLVKEGLSLSGLRHTAEQETDLPRIAETVRRKNADAMAARRG